MRWRVTPGESRAPQVSEGARGGAELGDEVPREQMAMGGAKIEEVELGRSRGPAVVTAEMLRVLKPGWRIAVTDLEDIFDGNTVQQHYLMSRATKAS